MVFLRDNHRTPVQIVMCCFLMKPVILMMKSFDVLTKG